MKVAFLSSSVSKKGGGVTEVKRRLAQTLVKIPGVQVQVFGLVDEETNNDRQLWSPFQPHAFPVSGPAAIGYARNFLRDLKSSDADLVHLHGLWQYPSYVASKAGKPYITTVHGMLDRWAVNNSKFKKQIASILYERSALRNATCLQAFNMQEYEDIRSFGLKNPVCLIPNGVDLPGDITPIRARPPVWDNMIAPDRNVLLYLGRIHPKKGLTNLLRAWKKAKVSGQSDLSSWALAIAGWDQGGYEQQLAQLSAELQLQNDVFFLGPQFGAGKQNAFAHAKAFILPSFSEGLPMAVLEAWSFNLPVLITKHCNLPEGIEAGAAISIDPTEESVAEGLVQIVTMPENKRVEMGQAGYVLVKSKFTWQSVADSMHQVYQWMLNESKPPNNLLTR